MAKGHLYTKDHQYCLPKGQVLRDDLQSEAYYFMIDPGHGIDLVIVFEPHRGVSVCTREAVRIHECTDRGEVEMDSDLATVASYYQSALNALKQYEKSFEDHAPDFREFFIPTKT